MPTTASRSAVGDVVRLKNGSIIRGSVIELIPDSIIKIETDNKSLFICKMSEVESISKEIPSQVAASKIQEVGQRRLEEVPEADFNPRKPTFSASAAMGIPVGEYADGADMGFGFRGEASVPIDDMIAWTASVSGSFNPVKNAPSSADISPFSAVYALTGFQISANRQRSVVAYFHGQVGAVFGSLPTLSSGYSYSGGTAFAFGIGAGIVFSRRVNVGVNYLSGRPEFEITGSTYGSSVHMKGEIPMSVSMISIGVAF
ncbi:MAG: hypothetical protein HY961_21865 [Ignavibacteriae bacterium]|nr:hypothetical protein [Ignavibacteriota bacterium]